MKTFRCKLCKLKCNDKIDSHIIPRYIYKWVKDTAISPYLREAVNPNVRKQDGETKNQFLCRSCEKIFNDYETKFANKIFYPYVSSNNVDYEYEEWLLKFAVSQSWRMLALEIDTVNDQLAAKLNKILDIWSDYILEKRENSGLHSHHLLFFKRTPDLPTNKEDYFCERAIDGSIGNRKSKIWIYSKLAPVAVVSHVKPLKFNGWRNSLIHKKGRLQGFQLVTDNVFNEFFIDRINFYINSHKKITEKQNKKISQAF